VLNRRVRILSGNIAQHPLFAMMKMPHHEYLRACLVMASASSSDFGLAIMEQESVPSFHIYHPPHLLIFYMATSTRFDGEITNWNNVLHSAVNIHILPLLCLTIIITFVITSPPQTIKRSDPKNWKGPTTPDRSITASL
jgi:hypothetical protein